LIFEEKEIRVTINFKESANFIWSIADLLRGDYKQSEYGRVIIPLTVLRRLDCVLEPTKEVVLVYLPQTKRLSLEAAETVLKKKAKLSFYNKSKFDFYKLVADPNDIAFDPAPKNCTVYKLSLPVYNRNERGLYNGKAQIYRRADYQHLKEA